MNVFQSVPRKDCKVFAKCGVKSLSHCRRYRGNDEECKKCTLIRRKPQNRKFDANGREMKKYTLCGHYFYLYRFYDRVIHHGGKTYHCKCSRCRMCMSKINSDRAKNKVNKIQ